MFKALLVKVVTELIERVIEELLLIVVIRVTKV